MTDTKQAMTRTDIEQILEPLLGSAGAEIPGDLDHQRRLLRALVHLGVRRLLATGASPRIVGGQVLEALAKEIEANQASKEAGMVPPSGPVVLA